MQYTIVTRQNWLELVRDAGIRLEEVAVRTGLSYSAVYRYGNGSRTPSDEWIAKVAALLTERRAA